MSQVHWIIENIVKEPSFLELSKAVERAGHPLLNLNGDFKNAMLTPLSQSMCRVQCVVFNGSIEMCKLVMPILYGQGCSPILYCTWENYQCHRWYGLLAKFLFNDDYVMVPLSEVKRRMWWFYGAFAKEATIFIRPDSGDKTFKGGAIDLQDFERFYDQYEADKDQMVIVSSPKTIRGEWRFVVTAQTEEIIAVSSYRYQGLATRVPSAPHGATDLCKTILAQGYYPDKVFCIDIAEDADGNFWLLELTSFSSAGLYACNMDAIVKRVSEIALKDYESRSRE